MDAREQHRLGRHVLVFLAGVVTVVCLWLLRGADSIPASEGLRTAVSDRPDEPALRGVARPPGRAPVAEPQRRDAALGRTLVLRPARPYAPAVQLQLIPDEVSSSGNLPDATLGDRPVRVEHLPETCVLVVWGGSVLARADLRAGDAEVCVSLPATRRLELTLHGECLLGPLHPVSLTVQGRPASDLASDRERQSITAAFVPPDPDALEPLPFALGLPGMAPCEGVASWSEERGTFVGDACPVAPGALKVRVTSRAPLRGSLRLQRRVGDGWAQLGITDPWRRRLVVEDEMFEHLLPGVYRVLENASKTFTESVAVHSGQVTEIAFDLESVRSIAGRVELPGSWRPADCTIALRGRDDSESRVLGRCSPSGQFWVQADLVPGQTLTALHPVLWLDERASHVDLGSAHAGDLLFVFREGPFTSLSFHDRADPPQGRRNGQRPRLLIRWDDRQAFEPVPLLEIPGGLGFKPPRSGSCTLFLDLPGQVPRRWGPVELDAQRTSTIDCPSEPEGSALVVERAATSRGGECLQATVLPEGEPAYERLAVHCGAGAFEVSGVGGGWARVQVFSLHRPSDVLIDRRVRFEVGLPVVLVVE